MFACTFFGHRDCPAEIYPALEALVYDLISAYGVDTFYVGEQGNFDALATRALCRLSETFPHVKCYRVLTRLPARLSSADRFLPPTLLPEGIEEVPPKFAVDHRNRWMLFRSVFVIGYVRYSFGGAAKFLSAAKRHGKTVFNLAVLPCDDP